MKSQAINSFPDGLVSDLSEMNTPAKVMTDALNATLITYNGNEFILQNDMGNVPVGTAYLPKGYVPVGMKEHGGIIYVASHNPETKKGQIGCFPSPQMLYSDEDTNLKSFNIDLSQILEYKDSILYINQDFYRQEIFQKEVNGITESKEFHPGDKFIITSDLSSFSDLLISGVLKIKLASVGKDGVINYIPDENLKLYENNTFIYENKDNSEVTALLSENNLIQVFPGKTSGKLMVVIEYNVFDGFDLTWKYNINGNEIKSATFTGNAVISENVKDSNVKSNEIISLNDSSIGEELTVNVADNAIDYKIAPYSDYGISKKLIKSGKIDISELMANKEGVLNEWSYTVTKSSVVINWDFNYFDLNGEEITEARFVFIPFDSINSEETEVTNYIDYNSEPKDTWHTFPLSHDSYIGNFDEYIPFDGDFQWGRIYVCVLDIKKGNNDWQHTSYNYIYTTGLFSGKTSQELKDYAKNRPTLTANIDVDLNQDPNVLTSKKYYYTTNPSAELSEIKLDTSETLKSPIEYSPQESDDLENPIIYKFRSGVYESREYTLNGIAELKNYTFNNEIVNREDIIHTGGFGEDYKQTLNISKAELTKSDRTYNGESKFVDKLEQLYNSDSNTYRNNISFTSNSITLNLYKDIYGEESESKTQNIEREKLCPIYEPNGDINEHKLFGFSYRNGNLVCTAANAYGTYGQHTVNTNEEDASNSGYHSSGGTYSDLKTTILNEGDKTINILSGIDVDPGKKKGIYTIWPNIRDNNKLNDAGNAYRDPGTQHYTNIDTFEMFKVSGDKFPSSICHNPPVITNRNNFLIGMWKNKDGHPCLINLVSGKSDIPNDDGSINLRVDKKLKMILSQLLIAKYKTDTMSYIKPIKYVNSVSNNVITLEYNNCDNISTDSYTTNIDKWYGLLNNKLKNYLPSSSIGNSKNIKNNTITISDEDLSIADLISEYTNTSITTFNVKYHPKCKDINDWISNYRNHIYLGTVTSIDNETGVCTLETKNGEYTLYDDGNPASHYLYRPGADGKPNPYHAHINNPDNKSNDIKNYFDINKYFITKIKNDNYTGHLPSDYYNEVFINISEHDSDFYKGKCMPGMWIVSGNRLIGYDDIVFNAPPFYLAPSFGNLSYYKAGMTADFGL